MRKRINTTHVCSLATKNRQWTSLSYNQKYVKEAKRRGLSCGVGGSTQTASLGSSSNKSELASYSNNKLCQNATYNSGSKSWWNTSKKSQKYVKEAKRRGLSCGVVGSTQTASSGFSSNLNSTNN